MIILLTRLAKVLRLRSANKQRLLSNNFVKQLIEHYGGNAGHNLDENKGTLGYGLIHYALIANCKPDKILCIGSKKGFIPSICALACRDNQKGHVDFVDAGYDENHPNNWGGVGFWKRIDSKKHFSFYGLSEWITTYVMTSVDFVKKNKKRWQYIYIDADHSYKGVKRDFKLCWPRLAKGGFMVFHDVLLKQDAWHDDFGVWRFWQEIRMPGKITIPFTHSNLWPSGLGILQK